MQGWFREFVLAREAKSPLSSVVKITMIRRWSNPGQGYCSSPEYGDANDQTVELNFRTWERSSVLSVISLVL